MAGLVISLNPAMDVEWRLDRVLAEEKNEIQTETRWPGGKGINVARWLRWLGVPARLFLSLGGATGRELATGLRAEGLRFTAFRIPGSTRANVVVTPREGPQYRFNATWPRLVRRDALALRRAACERVAQSDPVIISGTLAFGAPSDTYAAIVRSARKQGRRVFLDCDREPFEKAAREQPFLVKPNEYELGQWMGRRLTTERDIIRAAQSLASVTHGWVLVSRGGDGALLVSSDSPTIWKATVPRTPVRNTVGAGDALLAGVVAGVEARLAPQDWLRQGVATGTAATQVPPGQLPSRSLWRRWLRQVDVTPGAVAASGPKSVAKVHKA